MTVINPANVPNAINTVEMLHAYTGLLLCRMYPTLSVLETDTIAQNVAQAQIFQAADQTTRLLTRTSLILTPAYTSDNSKKLWGHVIEFGQVAIPQSFTSN